VSLTFIPNDGAGHLAEPRGGTYKQQRNGRRANLLRALHYPVTAQCVICGGRIILMFMDQVMWRHAAAESTKPAKQPVSAADVTHAPGGKDCADEPPGGARRARQGS
jgi:hypothetical protein